MLTHRTCIKCEEEKLISEFSKQSSNADGSGYKSYCRLCYKDMRRKYYLKDPKKQINRSKRSRERLQYEFQLLKSKLECENCGESDPRCLDFHHINPKLKLKPVRDCFFKNGKTVAEQEINKCEVLCANCHRKHHHELTITAKDVSDLYPSIGEGI